MSASETQQKDVFSELVIGPIYRGLCESDFALFTQILVSICKDDAKPKVQVPSMTLR